ncbi:MAG: histidine kinase [Spirochaetales bacterium]|nr:histidine kinase [Spirochaetales bacterium]
MAHKTFKKLKLKNKLLTIYITGFLMPIFTINILLSYKIYLDEYEYEKSSLINNLSTVSVLVKNEFNEVFQLVNSLYINKDLYTFINSNYSSLNDYLKARTKFFQTDSVLNRLRTLSVGFRIYTKNKIFTPDPIIMSVNAIKNEIWYREFINSSLNGYIFYNNKTPDYITFIRTLDYRRQKENRMDNLLVIEIPVSKIIKHLNNFPNDSGISFISHKNQVIYSNQKVTLFDYRYLSSLLDVKILSVWYLEGRLHQKSFWEYFLDIKRIKILLLILGVILLGTISIYILSKSFYTRIYNLSHCMNAVNKGQFIPVQLDFQEQDEIFDLSQSYNIMVDKIDSLIHEITDSKVKSKDIELSRNKAQLEALISQINPHYIFNVLESIRMKSIVKNEKETANIIKHLSRSFRTSINWSSTIIDLEQELEIVKDFLIVQKYRFGDKLEYSITVDPKLYSYKIPKFSIQPFIENSAIHGLEKSSLNGEIRLNINLVGNLLQIEIIDNGVGISADILEKLKSSMENINMDASHIGFSNTYWRLKNLDPEFKLYIESQVGFGTRITLILSATGGFNA